MYSVLLEECKILMLCMYKYKPFIMKFKDYCSTKNLKNALYCYDCNYESL